MPSTITPLTNSHQLLLKAACCPHEVGVQAWEEWQSCVDIEQLDSESYHLLPLLYKNLAANQVGHPEMTRLQGVYRRHWYSNQLIIRELTTVLHAFQTAAIHCLVLGDAALLGYYGSDLGVRPIEQLDLLVSPQDAVQAMHVLAELNWNAKVKLTDSFMTLHSKIGLWNSSRQLLHLHWRIFGTDSFANSKDERWQPADVVSLNHYSIHTLSPVAQILYLCTRITAADGAIAPLWIADFVKLVGLNPSQEFWESLTEYAVKARLTLPLQRLINAGLAILDLPPSAVVQQIQSLPISQLERLEQRFGGPLGRSPLSRYLQYLRQAESGQRGANPSLTSLLSYYQTSWGLKQAWQVPIYGISRLAHHIVGPLKQHKS